MQQARKPVFPSHPVSDWTPERLGQLKRDEIEQLRINAGDRGADSLVALCDEALKGLPKARGAKAKAKK